MKTDKLNKQRARLERRIFDAEYREIHRESMRKAYSESCTVKMHEFRGGRTVSITKEFGDYRIIVWNGTNHAFIENPFRTEEAAIKFATTLWGNIGWNIK